MANENNKGWKAAWARFVGGPDHQRSEGSTGSAGGDSPLVGVQPPSRNETATVTAEKALTLPAVYRAVSLLSTTASQLPLGVWRWGTEIEVVSTNNNAWLRRPDVNTSQHRFIERTVVSLATAGNAYWRVFRADANASIDNLEVWNPHNVIIEEDDNGRTWYHYDSKRYADWQVKHLRLLDVPGSHYGLGPIQAANRALRGNLDLNDYADNWFRQAGVPNGILSAKTVLTPEQAQQYKEAFEATQAGQRGVAVLGSETSYQPVYLKPEDAQFLQNQSFTITQVARMFGIPANKLLAEVNGSAMTYQNMEQANTDFVRDTLTQYLKEIEEAFTDLLPRGQEARFKVDALMRADQKTRFDAYALAISNKFMTVNEVRAREGLAPLDGGDKFPEPPLPKEEGSPNSDDER